MINLEYCITWRKRDEETYLRFHVNAQEDFELLFNVSHKEICISGLNQKYFEYFCSNFAKKFEIIQFCHCNLIKDFAPLELLDKVHFITIDWNNKATKLWNMSKNISLKGLYFNDLMKITTLDGIEFAPSLTELFIDQGPDVKLFFKTLSPLANCYCLKELDIRISGILDGSALPILKMPLLEKANFRADLFETEQFAMMVSKLKNVKLSPNVPYFIYDGSDNIGKNTVLIVGKKQRNWINKNSEKIKQYEMEWNEYIKKYR